MAGRNSGLPEWEVLGLILFSSPDRLVVDARRFTVATPTLRVLASESPNQVRDHLREALTTLFDVYGTPEDGASLPEFHVTVTANLLLCNASESEFQLWFGQDFSKPDRTVAPVPPLKVHSPSDLESIPTEFSHLEFQNAFEALHENSEVHVKALVCLVYVFKLVVEAKAGASGDQPGRHQRAWTRRL